MSIKEIIEAALIFIGLVGLISMIICLYLIVAKFSGVNPIIGVIAGALAAYVVGDLLLKKY